MPGKSRYRRCEVKLQLDDYGVNQVLAVALARIGNKVGSRIALLKPSSTKTYFGLLCAGVSGMDQKG